MDPMVLAIHNITLKTIHPALEKGPAFKAERVAQFLAAQSRVNGQHQQFGSKPLCDSSVPAVRNIHNSAVPVRPVARVSPAPFLPGDTCPSGACSLHE